jgi:hypothetical protein
MELKEKIKLRLEFLNTKKDSWGQANIDDRKYEIGLILLELEKMKCSNCKLLKVWVKKQNEKNRCIYCCNYMESQDIEKDYCSYFKFKE